ncbi:MAG TPA: DUF2642 domain-containing protein [Symbiobacteriaceae bacterium]|nr:DUF2642 domain-containing protein [Symbiobacteriaceae bacterium]
MPSDLAAALNDLIGQVVTVSTTNGTFTGTIASVTNNLLVMAANGGVVYIRPAEIVAVSTGGGGTVITA